MKQIQKIKESKINSFPLKLSNFDSFATCPYLQIKDDSKILDEIRNSLNSISKENSASTYTPHITLGLYNKIYEISDVFKDISLASFNDIEFDVNEIVFAQYETKDVQGPYKVLHRICLE